MEPNDIRKVIQRGLSELLNEQAERSPDAPSPSPAAAPTNSSPVASGRDQGVVRVARGAYGTGGRFKDFVRSANARAKTEPKELMKDLGINSAATGEDIAQIKRILNTAFHSNATMRSAYAGVRGVTELVAGNNSVDALGINLAGLDKRNGIKFIMHVLSAAKRAGYLNLAGSIEINKGAKAPIILYSA